MTFKDEGLQGVRQPRLSKDNYKEIASFGGEGNHMEQVYKNQREASGTLGKPKGSYAWKTKPEMETIKESADNDDEK